MKANSIHILLVEDNEGDIVLITDAFEEAKIINNISVVRDGQQALDFLNKKGSYSDVKEPNLVILDVNLPKKNGHEVLKEIKSSKKLCHIPVIMLTTSSSPSDITTSYKNHVNCYITKPVDVDDFIKVVLSIESFWISIVQLPDHAE
ncbi:MAG TPA: response regulator [Bacteroidetes bacterium]|nr:response regulator [Bacteroidota bacterium]